MNCPDCGVEIESPEPSDGKRAEFCPKCGAQVSEADLPSSVETEVFLPPESIAPQPPAPAPMVPKDISPTQRRRLQRARQSGEMRRLIQDLSGRVNDLQIQFDRRIEAIGEIIVKLTRRIEDRND